MKSRRLPRTSVGKNSCTHRDTSEDFSGPAQTLPMIMKAFPRLVIADDRRSVASQRLPKRNPTRKTNGTVPRPLRSGLFPLHTSARRVACCVRICTTESDPVSSSVACLISVGTPSEVASHSEKHPRGSRACVQCTGTPDACTWSSLMVAHGSKSDSHAPTGQCYSLA